MEPRILELRRPKVPEKEPTDFHIRHGVYRLNVSRIDIHARGGAAKGRETRRVPVTPKHTAVGD